jgi:hypothetical protein
VRKAKRGAEQGTLQLELDAVLRHPGTPAPAPFDTFGFYVAVVRRGGFVSRAHALKTLSMAEAWPLTLLYDKVAKPLRH